MTQRYHRKGKARPNCVCPYCRYVGGFGVTQIGQLHADAQRWLAHCRKQLAAAKGQYPCYELQSCYRLSWIRQFARSQELHHKYPLRLPD